MRSTGKPLKIRKVAEHHPGFVGASVIQIPMLE